MELFYIFAQRQHELSCTQFFPTNQCSPYVLAQQVTYIVLVNLQEVVGGKNSYCCLPLLEGVNFTSYRLIRRTLLAEETSSHVSTQFNQLYFIPNFIPHF